MDENTNIFQYTKQDGKPMNIAVIRPEFSLDGLSDNEKKGLNILSNIAKMFTPIFARQQHSNNFAFKEIISLLDKEPDEQREKLKEYFAYNLSPFDVYGNTIDSFPDLVSSNLGDVKFTGIYPQDMTEEEFNALPKDEQELKHSIVVRGRDNDIHVVPNSEFFEDQLNAIVSELSKLKELGIGVNRYVDATTDFLLDESLENRLEHFREWKNNESKVEFHLDTAVEEDHDQLHGIRGSAHCGIYRVVDDNYSHVRDALFNRINELDEKAPWKYKALSIKSPVLKFLDVLEWVGSSRVFPAIVLAQNLPNETYIKEEVGPITLVYANITNARNEIDYPLVLDEFFPHKKNKDFEQLLCEASMYMITAHEFGHATGRVTYDETPQSIFGENQSSILEEGRAELFSMFAMTELRKEGVISEEMEEAGYYDMAASMVKAMSKGPRHHSGARNLMFNYFIENGALIESSGERPTYSIDMPKAREVTKDLLGIVADIRAEGRVDDMEKLLGKYITTHRQEEFEERLKTGFNGSIVLFPEITKDESGYSISHPSSPVTQRSSIFNQ